MALHGVGEVQEWTVQLQQRANQLIQHDESVDHSVLLFSRSNMQAGNVI